MFVVVGVVVVVVVVSKDCVYGNLMCKYAVLSPFEMFLSMNSCVILRDLHTVRLENATNITE